MNEDKNKEEDKEDKEEDTSSDEEEAVRSYDIIVSRGGKREDEGEEETKQKERPGTDQSCKFWLVKKNI